MTITKAIRQLGKLNKKLIKTNKIQKIDVLEIKISSLIRYIDTLNDLNMSRSDLNKILS